MLAPDSRAVATDLLRPPAGYHLDRAVLTTYSLDLETLLALPLAVMTHADGSVEELLSDPLLLLQALRDAGERVQVFVDEAGMARPGRAREIYSALEPSVHHVRAPNGGVFHPKVWVARFIPDGDEHEDDDASPLLRVAVLSRNLTFDRSWDVALASEAKPAKTRRGAGSSKPLADLLRTLPDIVPLGVPGALADSVRALAEEVSRTRFPSPAGCDGDIAFKSFGLSRRRSTPWQPKTGGTALLAIAPFANETALDAIAASVRGPRTLVSRQEALDAVEPEVLEHFERVLVLKDEATAEAGEEDNVRPSGLHAKVIVVEHSHDVTWFVGSANLTDAAFTGRNVEVMASITGRKGYAGGKSGMGLSRFEESGFLSLCRLYQRATVAEPDAEIASAQDRLRAAKTALARSALSLECTPSDDSWILRLSGPLKVSDGVRVDAWPISVNETNFCEIAIPDANSTWTLPESRLTAFIAFRLSVPGVDVDDVELTLKLPAENLPEGRLAKVLRALIDTPERLILFLRALLGGLEGLVDSSGACRDGESNGAWDTVFSSETILADLLRMASREPKRLEPVRRLIEELRSTEEGSGIVPDDFFAIWQVVEQALGARTTGAEAGP